MRKIIVNALTTLLLVLGIVTFSATSASAASCSVQPTGASIGTYTSGGHVWAYSKWMTPAHDCANGYIWAGEIFPSACYNDGSQWIRIKYTTGVIGTAVQVFDTCDTTNSTHYMLGIDNSLVSFRFEVWDASPNQHSHLQSANAYS